MGHQRLGRRFLTALAAGAITLGCSPAPGNAETDRMVNTVSEAIVYPHQNSALGLARVASQTAATVFSAEDLDAETPSDPHARLGMQLHDPYGTDLVVEAVLDELPAKPAAAVVRRRTARRMPTPPTNDVSRPQELPPAVEVAVVDGDVGVALWEPSSRACLLGALLNGDVLVWRPSRVQMQPGELSCDPETALARQGTRPPH